MAGQSLSRLAKDLKPYIVPWIVSAAGGGGGSAGLGGAPSPHALDGAHHTGTLSDVQGPQFLKSDGSRDLTGNLGVADGVTIDGVDLSVHVANPNAHHNRLHNIASLSDHSASGLTVGQVLRANGASSFVWAQLQHNDLGGVSANQHHNQVHNILGGDHTVSGGANFDIIGQSAANTLARLTPSSNVSAGAAAILRSTAAGGLGLASMFTTGAVDVGQGLTAAGTGFRVIYHTHDYNHAHVVVNPGGSWTLDEQFGVDIDDNLLVRGWIVGKHAIQIEGAVMLCHYDGPEPYNLNFKGNPTGHMGQVGVSKGGVIYRPGKWGKAVQIAAAGINLVTNPSFETNTTGWTKADYSSSTSTWARTAGVAQFGEYYGRLQKTNALGGTYVQCNNVTVTPATTYTLSVWVNLRSGGPVRLFSVDGGTATYRTETSTTDEWVQLSATVTAANSTLALRVDVATESNVWIDGAQIAQGPLAPYIDGSLGGYSASGAANGAGHSWSGTAHGSSSSRLAASLMYAEHNIDREKGTIIAWVYLESFNVFNGTLFSANDSNFRVLMPTDGSIEFSYGTAAGGGSIATDPALVSARTWHQVAVTWDLHNGASGLKRIFFDGTLVKSGACAGSFSLGDLYIGTLQAESNRINGYIDDLTIVSRAMSEDEIRTIYESNAPVFAETSTWHWRSGRNRIYADAEGLWGYGASGGAILGLYAGDEENAAATKSWGGLNLSEGDFLLGRYGASVGGWLWFDQDLVGGQPGLAFGYADTEVVRFTSGGADLTGVLNIDTSGGIWQGAGSFGTPTTGIKLHNSSGVGRLASYSGGNEQWVGDTDGKLKAGNDGSDWRVWMDRNGLQIEGKSGSGPGWASFASPGNYNQPNQLSFMSSGNVMGGIQAFRNSSTEAVTMDVYAYAYDAEGGAPQSTLRLGARTQALAYGGFTGGPPIIEISESFGGNNGIYAYGEEVYIGASNLSLDFNGHVLDIYRENTWTPTITGSSSNPTVTYSVRSGDYVRIGKCVFYRIFINIGTYSGGSGSIRISLPLTVNASIGSDGTVRMAGVDVPASTVGVTFSANTGTAYGNLIATIDDASESLLQTTALAAGDTIAISGCYFV